MSQIRIDLADYGRVQVVVDLTGDLEDDTRALLNALQAVNDATRDVLSWDDDYKSLKTHLIEAWSSGKINGATTTAPPRPQRPAPAQSRSRQEARTSFKGTGLYCPDHRGVELIESKAEYQEYSFDAEGNEIPDKFFCPARENGTGKNHNVWRSRAVVGESATVPVGAHDEEPPPPDDDSF